MGKIPQETIFQSEAMFRNVYTKCMKNEPIANEEVKNSYDTMRACFEKYIAALQEQEFRYAFECGYRAAGNGGILV